MSNHTPGPWLYNIHHPTIDVGEPPNNRALVHLLTTSDADARLIAAAPELLQSCERLINAITAHGEMSDEELKHETWSYEAVSAARAAIRKATSASVQDADLV